ncbi:MAG: hypothetical protein GX601_09185 [Anaerolineales bacterium]|nr:hypothetical protein [Anaerolineales bacterium]
MTICRKCLNPTTRCTCAPVEPTTWGARLRNLMRWRAPSGQPAGRYWAARLGVRPDAVFEWWHCHRVPTGPVRARLAREFPGVSLPLPKRSAPPPLDPITVAGTATFDERLAALGAEQERIYQQTGRVRPFSLREIGGEHLTHQRVQQIEVQALERMKTALLLTAPGILADFGYTQAQIVAAMRELNPRVA